MQQILDSERTNRFTVHRSNYIRHVLNSSIKIHEADLCQATNELVESKDFAASCFGKLTLLHFFAFRDSIASNAM